MAKMPTVGIGRAVYKAYWDVAKEYQFRGYPEESFREFPGSLNPVNDHVSVSGRSVAEAKRNAMRKIMDWQLPPDSSYITITKVVLEQPALSKEESAKMASKEMAKAKNKIMVKYGLVRKKTRRSADRHKELGGIR